MKDLIPFEIGETTDVEDAIILLSSLTSDSLTLAGEVFLFFFPSRPYFERLLGLLCSLRTLFLVFMSIAGTVGMSISIDRYRIFTVFI